METELAVFIGVIVASTVFLFVRSFIINRMILTNSNMMHSENTDFLESQCVLLSMFTTFVVQASYLKLINVRSNQIPQLNDDTAVWLTEH